MILGACWPLSYHVAAANAPRLGSAASILPSVGVRSPRKSGFFVAMSHPPHSWLPPSPRWGAALCAFYLAGTPPGSVSRPLMIRSFLPHSCRAACWQSVSTSLRFPRFMPSVWQGVMGFETMQIDIDDRAGRDKKR